MALAAHAVNNKAKLDNMFAEQKKTRRDAAKKYGKYIFMYFTLFFLILCVKNIGF